MPITEIKNGFSENKSQRSTDQPSIQEKIDLEELAAEVYEKIRRELEIENERLGKS
jgi:hypothetical protein